MHILEEMTGYLDRNMAGAGDIIDDIWTRDIWAHKTVLYSRLGQPDSARIYYERFRDAPMACEYDYTCIMPYLTENGLYNDIITLSE